MVLDVAQLRADTPGCEGIVHLNNAGSALPMRRVLEAMHGYLDREATIGGYAAEDEARPRLDAAGAAVARLLGASATDVALTTSDTAAWSKAFWGLALSGWFDTGGRVLIDRAGYNSHYLSLLQARDRFGITVDVIESEPEGSIDLDDLDRRLGNDVCLVTATHVGTHRGLVNPVAAVGLRTRAAGIPYFLDACQSVGQLPVDVEAIGCDVATGTGRKFLRGPRGTGWLFVRPEWSERMHPAGIDGHSAEWLGPDTYRYLPAAARFEEFEVSYAGRIGFGVAVEYALSLGIETISARICGLAEGLRDRLAGIGAPVHDGGPQRSGIVTFSVPGRDPAEVKDSLAIDGIIVSVASAPWARLDMEPRGLVAVVRASPHAYNTEDELDLLVGAVSG